MRDLLEVQPRDEDGNIYTAAVTFGSNAMYYAGNRKSRYIPVHIVRD
jgi:hypothetical protein